MFNDGDFDVIVNDINEHADSIPDAQRAVTIDKWLTKLTAAGRGFNELNYLRLMRHMVIRGRISRPFNNAPPESELMPLSQYLDSTMCATSPPSSRQGCNSIDWDLMSCHRSSQTGDSDDDDTRDGDSYEEGDEDQPPMAPIPHDYPMGLIEFDRENPKAENVVRDDGRRSERGGAGGKTVRMAANASGGVATERDGHLAAAGEYWDQGKGVEGGRRQSAGESSDLCDPCVDGTGLRGRDKRGDPMDAAYRTLLGDCALPVFTEAEQKTVGLELLKVLQSVNNDTTLQDFFFQVAQYTCDQGEELIAVANTMMDEFKAFASDVFESRTEHISDGLAKDQMIVTEKYAYLKDRALNRATVALDYLREAVPVFNWHKYHADQEAYMKREIQRWMFSSSSGGDSGETGGGGGLLTGVEDEDGAMQQSEISKKLLYKLNWLRSEVTRTDCEGQRLYEQLDRQTACLVAANDQWSAAQCKSAAEIEQHTNEITLLRKKTADQTAHIDRMMETLQLTIQTNQTLSTSGSC